MPGTSFTFFYNHQLPSMLNFQDYDEVFTPGAPIQLPDFFVGRNQELLDLQRALKRPGLHPVIIGNRGVGKTSLVRQALAHISDLSVFVTCNSHMTFNHFAQAILGKLGIDISHLESSEETGKSFEGKAAPWGIGVGTVGSSRETHKRRGIGSQTLDPWLLFEQLDAAPDRVLIVVDEYDVIPSKSVDFHAGIAQLMKTLADHSPKCDSRLIIVGVAQSARDLLERHESIERSAREFYVRPLSEDAVLDFLSEAEERLGFHFRSSVKEAIVENSLGYPYYMHLVGLECIDAMLQRDKAARLVTEEDYQRAVRKAVSRAFRAELHKYKSAIQGLGDKEIAFIKELVGGSRRGLVVRQQLRWLLEDKKIMDGGEFNLILDTLQQKRLVYVSENHGDIRFTDPLMAPFLRTAVFPNLPDTHQSRDQLQLFDF
jgi:hypothetical protein